jgi:predicted nucleotidyltransferase
VADHQPTPYAEVNEMLRRLLGGVRARLGPHFVGMYLYGSLAAGDFSAESSDIDFLVVTDDELPRELFESLREMHARIHAEGGSKWAAELEGSYVPRRALRRYDPRDARHPHIDRGGSALDIERHDADWVVQRHVLHERGVALAGPPIASLVERVGPKELREGVRELLRSWWVPMLADPTRLRGPGYQRYAVLTMCRMLYTFRHGAVVSKPAAARWALATLDRRWHGLIRRAAGHADATAADDLGETLEFIRYTSGVGGAVEAVPRREETP